MTFAAANMNSPRKTDAPKSNQSVEISVVLLDHSEIIFNVNKRDRGQILLDSVFHHLKCHETKYFSLQFPQDVPDSMRWLDPSKSIRKQFKRGYPSILFFRVKYYVHDLNQLKDDYARSQMFLQCKLDILENRLMCSKSAAAYLSALALQIEIGDFMNDEVESIHISRFKFIPNQSKSFEEEVKQQHRKLRGLSPVQAQMEYLHKARTLKRYGMDMHLAKSLQEEDIEVGVTNTGLHIYLGNQEITHYKWIMITKISFKRKQFYIHLQRKTSRNPDGIESFMMDNYRSCKRLWKSCVDFHSFYRLSSDKNHGNRSSPNSSRSEKNLLGFFPLGNRNKLRDKSYSNGLPTKSSSTKMLATVVDTTAYDRKVSSSNHDDKAPRRLSAPPSMTFSVAPKPGEPDMQNISMDNIQFSSQHIYQSYMDTTGVPKAHVIANTHSESPVMHRARPPSGDHNSHSHNSSQEVFVENKTNNIIPATPMSPDDVFMIRLQADREGRFGFNIKGGKDQGMGIIVSKVAQNFPTDLQRPRLNEGDEILEINGCDVTLFSHEQAVILIRAAHENHNSELIMRVKPHVIYELDNGLPEPDMDSCDPMEEENDETTLHDSMLLLLQQLESGEATMQFERLYRKNMNLMCDVSKLPKNIPKNRYRDISPYDATRVTLEDWDTDYINANYINMPIPGTEVTNRYIASQGPLQNTCGDFWQMVWEQNSSLIVMVTALRERNHIKCHQYWPDVNTTQEFGNLTVESILDEITSCFAYRQFTLSCYQDDDTVETRNIVQMQYIAWPDHGVPEDSSDFLDFVIQVRQRRVGMESPTIVHCSAGIGRTGVMITMETAMCLIEANQPVNPILITKLMRDQRAMMIQTPSQFNFVCEAIIRVYEEGLAKPAVTDGIEVQSANETQECNSIESQSSNAST